MKPQASEGGRGYHAIDLGYIKKPGSLMVQNAEIII